jgi:Protein of unknown function (DUF3298)/Deacetylase PdaC
LLLSFLFSVAMAQDVIPDRFYYLGTVGTKPQQLELSLNNQQLSGTTIHSGQTWFLEGNWAYEGPARLNEISQSGDGGGLWLAKISTSSQDYAGTLTGTYDNGHAVAFSFHKIAEYVSSQLRQGRIVSTVTYPFFLEPLIFNEAVQTLALKEQQAFFSEGQALESKGEVFNGWTLETDYQIQYAGTTMLSLLGRRFMYTGGAHPNTDYVVINVQAKDDMLKDITLDDLFDEADRQVLTSFIKDELKKQDATWILDDFVLLTNTELSRFTFSALGITFYFPPYVVGPYAQGTFEVVVPPQILHDLGLESELLSFMW